MNSNDEPEVTENKEDDKQTKIVTESPINPHIIKKSLSKPKSLSLVKEIYDHNETLSILHKRKFDSINSKVSIETLKYHQHFTFRIDLTEKKVLLNNYINFGDILSVKNKEVVTINNDTLFIIQFDNIGETSYTNNVSYIEVEFFSKSMEKIYNGYNYFKKRIDSILCNNEIEKCELTWYTKVDGITKYYKTIEYLNDTFHFEAYPYFDCETMIKNYLKSETPILILIGPPGTGKTKLIRQILKEASIKKENKTVSALFTSSQEIIEQGQIYLDLIFANANFLILEDIDFHIKPRSQGNYSLYSLLSVSSGILSGSIKNRKIILSTNLPHKKDIDDALLRPGRCFGTIHTQRINKQQAELLGNLLKRSIPEKKDFSLAEIYN